MNRNEALSDYVEDSVFKVEFDVDESGAPIVQNGEVVFKNLHYTITDASLISLLEQGKMKGAFIVECSASVYRSRFEISTIPYDLKVSAHEINGNVVASCYLYAAEDMHALIMFHHLDLSHYFGICPIPALQSGQIMGLLLKKLWIIYIRTSICSLFIRKQTESNNSVQLKEMSIRMLHSLTSLNLFSSMITHHEDLL